ncbi:MAG TPA: glycosyltransferase family 1 protein [Ignavibacteriaceae bacterium]|nr:glycosyltransferase family 1 protein [Ignavibacteriaceae bacterium]
MKIAYFAGSMKPGHDGVTRVLYKLIEALNERNIENIFFSPIIPEEEIQPTRMFEIPSVTFPLYKDYKFPVALQKSFESRLNEFKPDLLHINSPCPLGFAAVKYGLRHNVPVVATYHTHFASYAKYYKVKALESVSWNYFRIIYNSCEMVYVPSKPILEELRSHGLANLQYLPHGVDNKIFNPFFYSDEWRNKRGISDKKILLFAGRLVWEKDLKTLADTYKIITQKRNDVKFVLAGDGPVKSELQALMPDALFLGHLSGSDLSAAFASSDIFVFPSTTETFGNVTLEAMASGIVPVCAREGGAYGIIEENKTGLIANPRDAKDFAGKIEFLLDNPLLRKKMSMDCFNYAKEQSWEKIFERLFSSYEEIIQTYKINRQYGQKSYNRSYNQLFFRRSIHA